MSGGASRRHDEWEGQVRGVVCGRGKEAWRVSRSWEEGIYCVFVL